MSTLKKVLSMKELGSMACVTVTVNSVTKTVLFTKETGKKV